MAGINNIKTNCGDDSVTDDHIQGVCRQILEEAKKMYACETRSITPDISDNVSDAGSLVENRTVRENKVRQQYIVYYTKYWCLQSLHHV